MDGLSLIVAAQAVVQEVVAPVSVRVRSMTDLAAPVGPCTRLVPSPVDLRVQGDGPDSDPRAPVSALGRALVHLALAWVVRVP